MSETPRVWIGCLACYNAGQLVGQWFQAIDCPTDPEEWINAFPSLDPIPSDHFTESHEELWVMDHDGFMGLLTGECSPVEAQELAEILESVPEADRPALAAWVSDHGGSPSDFEDVYCGVWDSQIDYAQNLAEELDLTPRTHSWPASYIDWESAARDLFMDYSWSNAPGGQIFVFRQ